MEDDSHRGQNTRQSGAIGDPIISGVGIAQHEDLPSGSGASSSDLTQQPVKYNYQLKKTRTQFTPKQILHLEEKFLENQFPSAREREAIANELNLTTQHIQVWFQNRRAKHRRKSKKKQTMDTLSAIEPPDFWPRNLSFDSNLSKGHIIPSDQVSKFSVTKNPNVSSEEISLSPVSTPSSEKFQTSTGFTSASSPLSSCSTATGGQDDSLAAINETEQSSALQSIASISSPSILAESPVRLYDILKDMPDLSASLLDDPSVVISTQSPLLPPVPSHPTLPLNTITHHSYGVHHDTPVHMPSSYGEHATQSSYLPPTEHIPYYTPPSHHSYHQFQSSDYQPSSYSYPPQYPDLSFTTPPSYTLYQPYPPHNQTQTTTQEVTPSITQSSQYGRHHCY